MRKLQQSIREQEIRLEMAKEHSIDEDYHRGYLQALRDVNNGDLRFLSKLDKIMKQKCISDTELGRALGLSRQNIFDGRLKGMKNETAKAKKIAEYLGVDVSEVVEDK